MVIAKAAQTHNLLTSLDYWTGEPNFACYFVSTLIQIHLLGVSAAPFPWGTNTSNGPSNYLLSSMFPCLLFILSLCSLALLFLALSLFVSQYSVLSCELVTCFSSFQQSPNTLHPSVGVSLLSVMRGGTVLHSYNVETHTHAHARVPSS